MIHCNVQACLNRERRSKGGILLRTIVRSWHKDILVIDLLGLCSDAQYVLALAMST